MKRRQILKYTAYITGAAVSLPLATTLLSGCKTDGAAKIKDYVPSFFSQEEFSQLPSIIDVILPKTDSPSASEVGVHKMIDSMSKTFDKPKLDEYRSSYNAFASYLKNKVGEKQFRHLPEGEKMEILKNLQSEKGNIEARKAFLELRQQTVAYYLNTEEVATNFLNYDPIPGDYIGCIPLSQVNGKKWAL